MGQAESRFISWNIISEFTISSDIYGDYINDNPNCSYLTDEDGTRQKLCPHDWCREDVNEICTHVDLSGGVVYFLSANLCKGSLKHPNRTPLGAVNMLLRYSIREHIIEKVLD